MNFDTFIFDLDGTLLDSMADITTGVNLVRAELDLPPLPQSTIRGYVGDGSSLLMQRSLPEGLYSEERLQRFLTLYGEHMLEQSRIYPGIREFLELHRGKRMAVVTNKHHALTVRLLEEFGISSFFQAVIGGDSAPEKKPHPGPVLTALQALDGDPASAVLIGDHHTDLRAGRAAGIRTCFCAWGIGEAGGVPSDFLAETPYDLPRLFPGEAR
jgi:phosphoglycolate phosphatase